MGRGQFFLPHQDIDDEFVLGWWVDASGSEKIQLALDDHEVCAVTPTKSLTPYASAYEGYMGNYGNTLDRWYRAAVVIWPKAKDFAVRAEAGSAWALQALRERIDEGELDRARADAESMSPFWTRADAATLGPALGIAADLRDASGAAVLARPFRLEMLAAENAPALGLLLGAYGEGWCSEVVDGWAGGYPHQPECLAWIAAQFGPLTRRRVRRPL